MIRPMLLAALALAASTTQAQAPAPAAAPAPPSSPSTPAKKEMAQKVLQLQQGAIEAISRGVVERPVAQLAQAAGSALQTQVPADKREAVGKSVDADLRKFIDESVPMLRERALKLAPSVFGSVLEEKFSEDELRQLIAWLESPVNKKFQQTFPDVQAGFTQKLMAEAGPLLDPKLRALQQKLRTTFAAAAPASAGGASSAPRAAPAPKSAK